MMMVMTMIIPTTKSFKSKMEMSRASNNKIPESNKDGALNGIVAQPPPNRRSNSREDFDKRVCVYRIRKVDRGKEARIR